MKRYSLLVIALCVVMGACCQNITGSWAGKLNFGGASLNLIFNISSTDSGYKATLDSPDQNAKGIPVSVVTFVDSLLTVKVNMLGASFSGRLVGEDKIIGTFVQGAASISLELTPQKTDKTTRIRPQEPKAPFPYKTEDVIFENKNAGIKLAGTLTIPEKGTNFPAVILVTGSGAQNRDEEIMDHKPFLVIADYLTRNGIAVLRYDDRGVAQSEGDFASATTIDLANDAVVAFDYLMSRNDINHKNIGLIGHSEGGAIAFINAAKNDKIAFIITLAAPGVQGKEIIAQQAEILMINSGANRNIVEREMPILRARYDLLCQNKSIETLRAELRVDIEKGIPVDKLADTVVQKQINAGVESMTSAWYIGFLKYNPTQDLCKIKCPIFALNGDKDVQVNADINLSAIKQSVKSNATVKKYPNLNHLFQHANPSGNPLDYGSIEETISPEVLSDIASWILSQK